MLTSEAVDGIVNVGTMLGIPVVIAALIQYVRNHRKDSLDAAMLLLNEEREEKQLLKAEVSKLQVLIQELRLEVTQLQRQLIQLGHSTAYFIKKEQSNDDA